MGTHSPQHGSGDDAVARLMEQSLIAWRLIARVGRADDGAITIQGLGRQIRIERAAADQLFRWMVTVDGNRRPALSIVAVLRQVRRALDPGYAASRVRIAAPREGRGGKQPD